MFQMRIPPDIESLLTEMEPVYPRVVKQIRLMWDEDQQCQNFFGELLTYKAGFDRDGFTIEAYRKLEIIQKEYTEQLFQFQTRNLSPEEREKRRVTDIWSIAYDNSPKKRKKRPWEDT